MKNKQKKNVNLTLEDFEYRRNVQKSDSSNLKKVGTLHRCLGNSAKLRVSKLLVTSSQVTTLHNEKITRFCLERTRQYFFAHCSFIRNTHITSLLCCMLYVVVRSFVLVVLSLFHVFIVKVMFVILFCDKSKIV